MPKQFLPLGWLGTYSVTIGGEGKLWMRSARLPRMQSTLWLGRVQSTGLRMRWTGPPLPGANASLACLRRYQARILASPCVSRVVWRSVDAESKGIHRDSMLAGTWGTEIRLPTLRPGHPCSQTGQGWGTSSIACGGVQLYITGRLENQNGNPG